MNEHTLYSCTVGLNVKNAPRIKVVKLTDHANACNSLTNFEYGELTKNGDYVNLLKLVCENS